jgi:hypothetical protein
MDVVLMSQKNNLYRYTLSDEAEAAHQSAVIEQLLIGAKKMIDAQFGDGYAIENPNLVGNFITSAALMHLADVLNGMDVEDIYTGLDSISDAIKKRS